MFFIFNSILLLIMLSLKETPETQQYRVYVLLTYVVIVIPDLLISKLNTVQEVMEKSNRTINRLVEEGRLLDLRDKENVRNRFQSEESPMVGKVYSFKHVIDSNPHIVKDPLEETYMGRVISVYTDCLTSGTNDYIPMTFLLVKQKNGLTFTAYPRDVVKEHYDTSKRNSNRRTDDNDPNHSSNRGSSRQERNRRTDQR